MGARYKKYTVITIGIPWRISDNEFFPFLRSKEYGKMAAFLYFTFIIAFLSTGHAIYVCNFFNYCLAVKMLDKTNTIICHSFI